MIHGNIIRELGRWGVNVDLYAFNVAGFGDYLEDLGVRWFTGNEVCRARDQVLARECLGDCVTGDYGELYLLPERDMWPRLGAALLWLDHVRRMIYEPVTITSAWRPQHFNQLSGGATGSDHIMGYAVDALFASPQTLQNVIPLVAGWYRQHKYGMGVGIGERKLHISFGVPQRRWFYDSAPQKHRRCWKKEVR